MKDPDCPVGLEVGNHAVGATAGPIDGRGQTLYCTCTEEDLHPTPRERALPVSVDPTDLKVHDRLRHMNGDLYHVRGFVDSVVVARRWSNRWHCWHYEAFSPIPFQVGLIGRDPKVRSSTTPRTELRRRAIFDHVACTTCGAKKSEPCGGKRGQARRSPHTVRIEAWRAAGKPGNPPPNPEPED